MPKLPRTVDYLVAPRCHALMPAAVSVAAKLREGGASVNMVQKIRKVKNLFNFADRIGAQKIVFVAEDEWDQGKVRIKNLRDSKEKNDDKGYDVAINDLTALARGDNVSDSTNESASNSEARLSDESIRKYLLEGASI